MSPRSIHRGPITAIRTSQAATSSVNHQLERMLRAISDLLLLPMPKVIGLPGHWRTDIFSHEAQIAAGSENFIRVDAMMESPKLAE
jgi:hypothetical protein